MNRAEHLKWCKDRAMEYVNTGDYPQAVASMISDLGKHEETKNALNTAIMLSGIMLRPGVQHREAADWVEGFR